MSPLEIVVIVLTVLFVAAVIGWNVYKKVTGKGGCDCGYDCGGSCQGCHACRRPADGQSCRNGGKPVRDTHRLQAPDVAREGKAPAEDRDTPASDSQEHNP